MTRRFLIGLMALSIGCNSGGGRRDGHGRQRQPPATRHDGNGGGDDGDGGHDGDGGAGATGKPRTTGTPGTAGTTGGARTATTGSSGHRRRRAGSRRRARRERGHHRNAGRGGTAGTDAAGARAPPEPAGATTANQNVPERNKNPSRDGHFVQPTITKAAAGMMMADTAFNTAATFTGNVAASPLYLDGPGGGLFIIPTGER